MNNVDAFVKLNRSLFNNNSIPVCLSGFKKYMRELIHFWMSFVKVALLYESRQCTTLLHVNYAQMYYYVNPCDLCFHVNWNSWL